MFPAVSFRLEVLEECRSSQETLLLKRGTPGFHGAAVLARRQTAGYGRRGRTWSSGEGNLALSLGLEIPHADHLSLLPFLAGIAAIQSARMFLGESPGHLRLKWPNDLYLDGKKLAGLISQARQYDHGVEVVLGLGLNLAHSPPDMPEATALAAAGLIPPEPEAFAHSFLRRFEAALVQAVDYAWIRREWEREAYLGDDPLYVVGEPDPVTPLALLETGELLVREKSGTERKLSSEEVSIRFQPTVPLP